MRDQEEEGDVDTSGERRKNGERTGQRVVGGRDCRKLPKEQDLGSAVTFNVYVAMTC